MSDPRFSKSRRHSRNRRSHGYDRNGHGCSKCHEESGYGERDFFEGRRGRGSEKIGWGRHGAVRLDDSPIFRRGRDDLDGGMGPPGEMDEFRNGYRDGLRAGRMARMRRASRMDPFGGQGGMDQLGGFGGMDPLGGQGMGMGMGMGGRGLLEGPMIARNPLGPSQNPVRHAFAEDPMLGLRQQALLRQGLVIEQLRSPLMGTRQGLMGDHLGLGLRSAPGSVGSGGSFDMRGMDRPRNPYGPLQNNFLQNRLANYRSPYVEDYEGSEMEAGMAQQAALMMNGGGNNPFVWHEGQYGYGGMGGMSGMGEGMNPY